MDLCGLTVLHHRFVATTILLVIECKFIVIAPIIIFVYIKNHHTAADTNSKHVNSSQNIQAPNPLGMSGLIFLITSWCTIILAATNHSSVICIDWRWNRIFFTIFYYTQIYLLWVVLFCRLYYFLKPTSYSLSPATFNTYCLILMVSALIVILRIVMEYIIKSIPMMIATCIFSLFLSVSILVLYVYKLSQVNHGDDESKMNSLLSMAMDSLWSFMLRNTILAFVCISVNVMDLICIIGCTVYTHRNRATDGLFIFCEIVTLVNILVIFICIATSYKVYHRDYEVLRECLEEWSKLQREEEGFGVTVEEDSDDDEEYQPLI